MLRWFGRNRDFQEVTLERDGETLLQFAAVYGFRNIQTLVHRMRKGRVPYQLVEVLSCPGGNAITTQLTPSWVLLQASDKSLVRVASVIFVRSRKTRKKFFF